MDIEQLSNDEFDDTFDIERIKKELKDLLKKKDLKEKNDRLIKELMEYQDKIASEKEKNS